MLNIKSVRYARKHNLGNYEIEEAELTAEISPSEDPIVALETLRRTTIGFFGEKPKVEKPVEQKQPVKPLVPAITVSKVNEALGEDAKLVNVSIDFAGLITVKPKDFLGTETFKAIASKLKAFDAEYVSAARDSRFMIKAGK